MRTVSLQLPSTEFRFRAKRLLDHIKRQQLSGAVLFDNYHITYFTALRSSH